MTVGRDISHYNPISDYDAARGATDWWQIKITESNNFIDNMAAQHYKGLAGDARGPYHFARPVNLQSQIAYFLNRKKQIGKWERADMLDCEFSGVDSAFIRAIVAEYRRQSGIKKLFIYLGYYDVTHACNPTGWWDPDIYMWVARYRKIGPPAVDGSNWKTHLQFDHPGLTTYQWDNATRIPGGDPDADVNYERVLIGAADMDWDERRDYWNYPLNNYSESHTVGEVEGHNLYHIADTYRSVEYMRSKLDILAGEVSDDEANILSAFRSGIPAVFSREQMDELKTAIREAQTDSEANAVVDAFWHRLAAGSSTNPNAVQQPGSEV